MLFCNGVGALSYVKPKGHHNENKIISDNLNHSVRISPLMIHLKICRMQLNSNWTFIVFNQCCTLLRDTKAKPKC